MENSEKPQKPPARYNKKRFSTNKLMIYMLLIVVSFVGIFAVINLSQGGKSQVRRATPLTFYKENPYTSNKTNIFYIKENKIVALNPKGEKEYEINDVQNEGKVFASEKNLLYYHGKSFSIFDNIGKLVTKKEVNGQVVTGKIVANSVIVSVLDDATGKTNMHVYDYTGQEEYKTPVDIGKVLDYGISDDATSLWVLSADISSDTPMCKYVSYNTKSNSVTSIINITDQITEKLLLTQNKIYAIGTNNILSYSLIGKKEESSLINGWKVVDDIKFVNQKPVFFLIPRSADGLFQSVRIKQYDGSEATFSLPEMCFETIIYKDKIYSFGQNKYFSCDYAGKNMQTVETNVTAVDVWPVFDNSQVILDNGTNFSLLNLE